MAVNDFGAFTLVRKSRHIPIIGRLLTGQNTDPSIWGFTQGQPERRVINQGIAAVLKHRPPAEQLMRHFRSLPIFCGDTAEKLAGRSSLLTVIADLPPHGLPDSIPECFTIMANLDTILISMFPCRDCQTCPQTETEIGETRAGVPIYRKRSTCYYKQTEVSARRTDYSFPSYVTGTIVGNG